MDAKSSWQGQVQCQQSTSSEPNFAANHVRGVTMTSVDQHHNLIEEKKKKKVLVES